jgi:Tfp pilus assembly protein PilF
MLYIDHLPSTKQFGRSQLMKSTVTAPKSPSKTLKPVKSAHRQGGRVVEPGSAKKQVTIAAASVAIITLLVFINCIGNGWVFDDYLHVVNPRLQSLSNIFSLLGHHAPAGDVSYAVDFWLWGWLVDKMVGGFHFTNVIVHTANAVLVLLICNRLLRNLPAAVLGSLIFALHPIQTTSVPYVSGRPGLLCALFYLAAFYLYLNYRQRQSVKMFSLALVCWLFSLMSSELAASFPVVIFLWSYIGEFEGAEGSWLQRSAASVRKVLRREGWLYLGMVVIVSAYTYYGVVAARASGTAAPGGLRFWGGSLFSNFVTELRVQAWLLKQLLYPTPIGQYLGAFPISTSIDWKVLLSAVLVLSALGVGIFALGRWCLVSFGILFYFAALLPVSQIIPNHELIADQYLYIPIFGLGLVAGAAARALAKGSQRRVAAAYAAAGGLLLLFAIITVQQNAVWADDRAFWGANYAKVPTSPRAVYGMAAQSITTNPRRAQDLFRQCLRLDPTYSRAYTALASLANNREDVLDVDSLAQTALEMPDNSIEASGTVTAAQFKSQVKTAVAIVKQAEGDQAAAESALWDAVSLDPKNPQPYEILGTIYGKDKDKQMDLLTRELSAIPDSIQAREGIVVMLVKEQKFDEAIPYLEGILSINSNDVFANYQMGQIYRTRKDCTQARAYLKKAASVATKSNDISDVNDALKQWVKECGSR